ncbi:MAG: major capsid protein [bacterium]
MITPRDLVALSIETLRLAAPYAFNYNAYMDALQLFSPMIEYIEGEEYIIPIDFDLVKDRYTLRQFKDYNLLQTVENDNSIHERFYVKGRLYSIIDEFQLDLSNYVKFVGKPISEYMYKDLESEIKNMIKRKINLLVDKFYNTLLYIFKQILENNTVVIDGNVLNIPFIDSSGNVRPRIDLSTLINPNFSSTSVNPEDELLKARDIIKTQPYILEIKPERYIVLMGRNAWFKFKNNPNIVNKMTYWALHMEQDLRRIKVEKYKNNLLEKVLSIEDIDIYVQDEGFKLKVNGNNIPFINPDSLYVIAVIPNNFVIPYNTGNYFINETPVIFRENRKFVEIVDITPQTADNIVSLRTYKVLGNISMNCLFTHSIGYVNTIS